MPPEQVDWSRVRAVFEQALDAPPAERARTVERACGDDLALRTEVQELLRVAVVEDGRLDPPATEQLLEGLSVWREDRLVGLQVADFYVHRVVSVGGMGVVYEAEQRQPRRRVALKALRAAAMSEDGARRFRYEAEILARLAHPNIARVFASGILDEPGKPAVPWIALEFVDGALSIVDYCTAVAAGWEQRIRLFMDVCAAVEHGHQRGVIHRDLKPDNVLVNSEGTPKVIDFGVARLADDNDFGLTTLRTQRGQIVGTIGAMSPEQIAGQNDQVDTRTDVYALGVLLYRLLVGRSPYDLEGRSLPEAAKVICETPPDLRTDRVLNGDLGVVLGKALEKEPARRYSSVSAFADDLGRILRRQPIAARPPSLRYQLAVLGQRHRVALLAGLVIVVVSVVAALVSLQIAANAERQRARGDALFRTFVDRSLAVTFDYAVRIHDLPNAAAISSDMISGTIADLEALEQSAHSHALRHSVALAFTRLGEVQGIATTGNLGDPAGARASFERARVIAESLVDERPDDPACRWVLARSLRFLGQLELQVGTSREARRWLEQAVEIADQLEADHPGTVAYTSCAAASHDFLANALSDLGQLDQAESHRARARTLYESLHQSYPDNERFEHHVVTGRNEAAGDFYRRGRAAETAGDVEGARAWYERSRRESLILRAHFEDHHGTDAQEHTARIWIAQGSWWAGTMGLLLDDLDQAESDLTRALEIYRTLAAEEPEDVRWLRARADTTRSLGNTVRTRAEQAGDPAERRPHWRRAREHYIESLQAWQELIAAQQLSEQLAGAADDVRSRIAACDAALAELVK